MQHTYTISGMTCSGCQAKVQELLATVPGVKRVTIDLNKGNATLDMEQHVPTSTLQVALAGYPKYQLAETHQILLVVMKEEEKKSWIRTYQPILLIFGYITATTLLLEISTGGNSFDLMRWMRHFMAGFFLIFSFFKLLDLKGFAESYATYDIVAGKWPPWGYLYAFMELG